MFSHVKQEHRYVGTLKAEAAHVLSCSRLHSDSASEGGKQRARSTSQIRHEITFSLEGPPTQENSHLENDTYTTVTDLNYKMQMLPGIKETSSTDDGDWWIPLSPNAQRDPGCTQQSSPPITYWLFPTCPVIGGVPPPFCTGHLKSCLSPRFYY